MNLKDEYDKAVEELKLAEQDFNYATEDEFVNRACFFILAAQSKVSALKKLIEREAKAG